MNELLAEADACLTFNNISDCWNALESLKRQISLSDSQKAFENLSHFAELKQKAIKVRRECGRKMQDILQACSVDPKKHEDAQALQCMTILAGRGDDFCAMYESLFLNIKKSIKSAIAGQINKALSDVPVEKSFIQSKPKEMNEIIHVFHSFENQRLGHLFAGITGWLLQLFSFLQNLLEIGQFKSSTPFTLEDVITVITDELLAVTNCFTQKSATSNVSFYLEDGPEHQIALQPDISLFQLPDFMLIHSVEFSKTKFYQKMAAKEEPNLFSLLSQTTVRFSIETLCSKIAPKNSFYTRIFVELFKFIGNLKGKLGNASSLVNGLQKRLETFYSSSFLNALQTKITNCINISFGVSSSFDPILVGSELDQIFKLVPELCNLFDVLSVCAEHACALDASCGGFVSNDISPTSITKDSFVKVMSKFESLFNFLFSERAKSSLPCSSNLIVSKIVKTNNFFLSLDLEAIDPNVVKKEFYSIFDFKKGRSFRREELLDQSKVEKILLLYRSLLFFQQNVKFDAGSRELRSRLDLLIFKIIYSLRIETMVQCVYYLELILFDKNENILYFVNQLVSFLAALDSQCLKVVGPKGTQFLWKGIGQFLSEFFGASLKQITVAGEEGSDENLKRMQTIMQHCIFNLCCNETME